MNPLDKIYQLKDLDINTLYKDGEIEKWQEHIDIFTQYFNQYLEQEEQKIKDDVKIEVVIDTLGTCVDHNKPFNARIMKKDQQHYTIYISFVLIKMINGFSEHIIENYKDYFQLHEKTYFYNKEFRAILSSHIFLYLLSTIFYHEWFHILRGHLLIKDYKKQAQIFLEVDADKYSAFLNIYFFNNYLHLSLKSAPHQNKKTLIHIYLTAQFELLYLLSSEKKGETHPDCMTRIVLYSSHVTEAYKASSKVFTNTFDLNYNDIYNTSLQVVAELVKKHNIDYKSVKNKEVELMKKYEKYIKEIKLCNYQLFNMDD